MNAQSTDALARRRAEPFVLTLEVAESDIDELGHASNIAYVRWVQDVALAHSAAVGFDVEAYMKLGGVFFIRRQEIDYVRPVLRGDRLEVRTWIDSASAAKSLRATEILRLGDPTIVAARAMTTWGFVEFASGRPKRIPESVRIAFGMPSPPRVSSVPDAVPDSVPDA